MKYFKRGRERERERKKERKKGAKTTAFMLTQKAMNSAGIQQQPFFDKIYLLSTGAIDTLT